jgi:hypothetical protein
MKTLLVFALLLPAVLAADDDSKPRRRVRLGGIAVGANYTSGPGWYPYSYYGPYWRPWGLYDPYWYSPFISPGLYTGFTYGPNMGEIKLTASDKEASVYLDGAYAGTANKLKSIWLEPGAYNLEVRDTGGHSYTRRVYILSGKTLRINANLAEAKP